MMGEKDLMEIVDLAFVNPGRFEALLNQLQNGGEQYQTFGEACLAQLMQQLVLVGF